MWYDYGVLILVLCRQKYILCNHFHIFITGTNCLCPHPPFQGYTTSCPGSVFPGYKIAYSCSAGYALTGNKSRTCQENGTWTGSDPTCAEGFFYDMQSEVLVYVEEGWKE